MGHDVDDTLSLLANTPRCLAALLDGLGKTWTHRNEGEGTWTVFDVVGHLIHADRANWIPRLHIILKFGEERAFEPFNRGGYAGSTEETLQQRLREFTESRTRSLAELQELGLTLQDLERRGQHPALGSVTVSELLAAWTAHDLDHLHQIARVLAYQRRQTVGPWKKFLGVMHCDAHGA
jgi:hypothetical protein